MVKDGHVWVQMSAFGWESTKRRQEGSRMGADGHKSARVTVRTA